MTESAKKMSGFSLTMMALGSIIGAGMFLGSGLTLQATGPSVLFAYLLLGFLMYFNLSFLAELSLADPEKGSFQSYAAKAFGSGVGFVIGWLYWVSGILVMSSEVTAAAIFFSIWLPNIPQWLFVLGLAGALTALNLIDARGFGKVESGLSIIKVIALIGFVLLAAAIAFTPWSGQAPGLKHLTTSPIFPRGLGGFAGSLLLVFYAYSGTSVVGLAIDQSANPKKIVPRVVLMTSILVTSLYSLSIFLILLLKPWSDYNGSTSPFISAMTPYGLTLIINIINIVIVTAALSAMNASMFGVSRMLYALAEKGEAPGFFNHLNRKNIPVKALLFSNAFLLLIAVLSYLIPNQLYLLVTGASGLLSLVNVLTITLSHWKLHSRLTHSKNGKRTFHALGYPVSNVVVAVFILFIFFSAFALPDQRTSFLLGLSLILVMSLVYWAVRKKLPAEPGMTYTASKTEPQSEDSPVHALRDKHASDSAEKPFPN